MTYDEITAKIAEIANAKAPNSITPQMISTIEMGTLDYLRHLEDNVPISMVEIIWGVTLLGAFVFAISAILAVISSYVIGYRIKIVITCDGGYHQRHLR